MPQCRREATWEGGRLNSSRALGMVKAVRGLAEGQQDRGSSGGSICCRSIQMNNKEGPWNIKRQRGCLLSLSPNQNPRPLLASAAALGAPCPSSCLPVLRCRASEWLMLSAFLRRKMQQPRMQAIRARAEMPKLVCKCVNSCIFKQVSGWLLFQKAFNWHSSLPCFNCTKMQWEENLWVGD